MPGHVPTKIAKQTIQQCVKYWRQKTTKTQNSMVHSASHDQLVVTGLPINCVINPPSSIDLWPQSLLKNPCRQLKWEKRRNVDRSVPLRWVSGRWWDRMRFICQDMKVWTFPPSKPAFQSQTWVKAKEELKPKGDEHRCAILDESAINRSPQRLKMQSSCRNKNKQTNKNKLKAAAMTSLGL